MSRAWIPKTFFKRGAGKTPVNEHPRRVGILAVQGDYSEHRRVLDGLGVDSRLVRHGQELEGLAGLILPGGESTTMLKFLANEGLKPAVEGFAAQGKPVLGTCAGAILLAKEVLNPAQESLGLLDISIERNAYGRQIDSSVRRGDCPELAARPLEMVFIRLAFVAPKYINCINDSLRRDPWKLK